MLDPVRHLRLLVLAVRCAVRTVSDQGGERTGLLPHPSRLVVGGQRATQHPVGAGHLQAPDQLGDPGHRDVPGRAAAVGLAVPARHRQAAGLLDRQVEPIHGGPQHHGRRHAAGPGLHVGLYAVEVSLCRAGLRFYLHRLHHLRGRRPLEPHRVVLCLLHDDLGHERAQCHPRRVV